MAKQRIAIVTDSTNDLPADVRENLGISMIPLNVVWGDQVLKDGLDINPTAFYERLQSDPDVPTTSQPSAGEFVDFFQTVANEQKVDTIVGVFISSILSGTISSAQTAKSLISDLNIEIVDSLSTSMGLGFQVMAAAEAVQAGGSVEEVVEAVQRIKYRMQILFVVDTLEFLHRGGRIGGAKRLVGTALKIKPLLELEKGKIEALDSVRTKKKALARLLEVGQERLGGGSAVRAAVIHANVEDEATVLQERVKHMFGLDVVHLGEMSPVIGAHTGPGTMGVVYFTE